MYFVLRRHLAELKRDGLQHPPPYARCDNKHGWSVPVPEQVQVPTACLTRGSFAVLALSAAVVVAVAVVHAAVDGCDTLRSVRLHVRGGARVDNAVGAVPLGGPSS